MWLTQCCGDLDWPVQGYVLPVPLPMQQVKEVDAAKEEDS